ncbi:MAG: protein translocase subunit SecD, partial [Actinobacteria bacterium ATB1]|nr:protein translocase subunit SecD [Actinobacteria bacterium ATB1]
MRNRRRLWLTLLLSLALSFGLLTWVVIAGYTPQLGLDLAGGTSVVLTAKGETSTDSLAEAVDIIRSRVDDLGVAEPEIITEGNENIVVQLPGLENEDQALDLIGTTAELGFRRVEAVFPAPQAVP